jgi:nucleoside 2-deoxyribosyltransferase
MRAMHGIQQWDVFFALLDDEDCYGTLAELGYAKGIGKQIVVGVHSDVVKPFYDKHGGDHWGGSELWFAIAMADFRIDGDGTSSILHQFAKKLRVIDLSARTRQHNP